MTSNYERYFGTPEKAAETISIITCLCDTGDTESYCYDCPIFVPCTNGNHFVWLQEEAE